MNKFGTTLRVLNICVKEDCGIKVYELDLENCENCGIKDFN